ncbi:unnamed protein product [Lactuca virosa]|uniref:Riboflavin kinase n=1 Tax=Lactuca virosa TaxID=75947 RepID=A0AAU9LLX5_9ASTR|nr:unnamed protein product [Lactuca virosa]
MRPTNAWKESFAAIVDGDEVKAGKPSPEIFLEASKRLNIDPSKCLVIEDSLPGIAAAKAANMEVVVVPSLPKQSYLYTDADAVITSLLDLHPEKWGLTPFEDWIDGTLPLEPWYIGGPVIKGYGRGSKEPWLLHKFDKDFYGEELHLLVVGYIRPVVLSELNSSCYSATVTDTDGMMAGKLPIT